MIELAEISFWVAIVLATWSVAASLAGGRLDRVGLVTSGRHAAIAVFFFAILASAGLAYALVESRLAIGYVTEHTAANLPVVYKLAALWTGHAGVLLLWAVLASGLSALDPSPDGSSGTTAVLAAAALASLLLAALVDYPFARVAGFPLDGLGMQPRLQHPLAVVQPPLMYVACALLLVPLAMAASGGRSTGGHSWSDAARGWTLLAWVLLTVAIVLGAWWVFLVPAWNMVWVEAPVRAGWLFPWLAATALLGALARNAPDSTGARSVAALAFVAAMVGAMTAHVALAAGVVLPAPSTAMWVTVALLVFVVLVVALWQGGRAASRRKLALVLGLALAGIAIVALAVAEEIGPTEQEVEIRGGQTVSVPDEHGRDWRLTSEGVYSDLAVNWLAYGVALRVQPPVGAVARITAEQRQYVDGRNRPTYDPMTNPGILMRGSRTLYVTLDRIVDQRTEVVMLVVGHRRFIAWAWPGILFVLAAGMLAWWPKQVPGEGMS